MGRGELKENFDSSLLQQHFCLTKV